MDPLSTKLIPFVPHPAFRRRKQIRKQKIAKMPSRAWEFQVIETTLIALRFHFEFHSTRITIPDRHALETLEGVMEISVPHKDAIQ